MTRLDTVSAVNLALDEALRRYDWVVLLGQTSAQAARAEQEP